MTVDSIETQTSSSTGDVKYDKVRKFHKIDGVGCVATWGARNGNNIVNALTKEEMLGKITHIDQLVDFVDTYLQEIYKPHELELEDVGYHVAGFDSNQIPRLFHIFWGFDRPRNPEQIVREYKIADHCPRNFYHIQFVYNGRNDLADTMVHLLLDQIRKGQTIRFALDTPVGRVSFADFIARFAGEITPEVGPPFKTFLISPDNQIRPLVNPNFCPLPREDIVEALNKLGYSTSSDYSE